MPVQGVAAAARRMIDLTTHSLAVWVYGVSITLPSLLFPTFCLLCVRLLYMSAQLCRHCASTNQHVCHTDNCVCCTTVQTLCAPGWVGFAGPACRQLPEIARKDAQNCRF